MTSPDTADLLALAARIEAYDPRLSPDNRADELALHQDAVMATGIGTLSPDFEATFLRSLDAAMTLVPEGCLASAKQLWDGPGRHGYALVNLYTDDNSAEFSDGKRHVGTEAGLAATPALALCAAALRAIATKGSHHA